VAKEGMVNFDATLLMTVMVKMMEMIHRLEGEC